MIKSKCSHYEQNFYSQCVNMNVKDVEYTNKPTRHMPVQATCVYRVVGNAFALKRIIGCI